MQERRTDCSTTFLMRSGGRLLFRSLMCLTTILLIGVTPAQPGASPFAGKLRINAQGTFGALGIWTYKYPNGTYGHGAVIVGTNETLPMPAPNPPSGSVLAGIFIKSHPFDTLGYPLHVSLVDKSFAQIKKLDVVVSENGETWTYSSGDPAVKETGESGAALSTFRSVGPIPADGPIPAELQTAFAFAQHAMSSIENLPDAQKSLKNYSALFVITDNTVWVELGPAFADGEAPHAGCQTQLGRDMVFGYDAKGSAAGDVISKWLQCF